MQRTCCERKVKQWHKAQESPDADWSLVALLLIHIQKEPGSYLGQKTDCIDYTCLVSLSLSSYVSGQHRKSALDRLLPQPFHFFTLKKFCRSTDTMQTERHQHR